MGVISPSTSYGYFFLTKGGSRPTGSTLCVFTIPHFRGFVNRFPPVRRTILRKAAGGRLRHIGLSLVYRKPCRDFELYPSGGPFLVPPRKGERMRLKEALKGLLPQTKPSSLRILPARTWYREAGFRHFLRKHPRIQLIPCQCAHWRGIEDHFGF